MFCNICSKELNSDVDICPYCGKKVHNVPTKMINYDYQDGIPQMLDDRILRNKHSKDVLPHDERMRKIISDFEFKTDIVFKPAPALRVYPSRQSYNIPEPSLTPAKVFMNIVLALLLPPVGLILGIVHIVKMDRRKKALGLVILILSICLLMIWALVSANFGLLEGIW